MSDKRPTWETRAADILNGVMAMLLAVGGFGLGVVGIVRSLNFAPDADRGLLFPAAGVAISSLLILGRLVSWMRRGPAKSEGRAS